MKASNPSMLALTFSGRNKFEGVFNVHVPMISFVGVLRSPFKGLDEVATIAAQEDRIFKPHEGPHNRNDPSPKNREHGVVRVPRMKKPRKI